MQDGIPVGHGTLIKPNGDKIEGVFSQGKVSGEGKIHFANGNVYTG
ncbi:MAG: hypothetical protein ACKO96_27730 [Flammeovirgaceae bacterium]